jgi:outer membrane protein assembly factor BamD (BamD/ComL family)
MKHMKLISIFLVFFLISGSLLLAQQEEKAKQEREKARQALQEAREIYQKAKTYLYSKEWERAIDAFRVLANTYKTSEYFDDSLYWLGYSMYKQSTDLENLELQLKLQQEAFEEEEPLAESKGV